MGLPLYKAPKYKAGKHPFRDIKFVGWKPGTYQLDGRPYCPTAWIITDPENPHGTFAVMNTRDECESLVASWGASAKWNNDEGEDRHEVSALDQTQRELAACRENYEALLRDYETMANKHTESAQAHETWKAAAQCHLDEIGRLRDEVMHNKQDADDHRALAGSWYIANGHLRDMLADAHHYATASKIYREKHGATVEALLPNTSIARSANDEKL